LFGLGGGTVAADGCGMPPHLDLIMVESVGEGKGKVGSNKRAFKSEEKGEDERVSAK